MGNLLIPMTVVSKYLLHLNESYWEVFAWLSLGLGGASNWSNALIITIAGTTSSLLPCGCVGAILLIYELILRFGLGRVTRTFTRGEAQVVAQGLTLYLFEFLGYVGFYFKWNRFPWIILPHHLWAAPKDHLQIALQTGLLGTVALGILLAPLFLRHRRKQKKPALSIGIGTIIAFYSIVVLVLGCLVSPVAQLLLGGLHPIVFVLEFVLQDKKRIYLLMYWGAMLVASLIMFPKIERRFHIGTVVARKLYHFLAVMLFLPAMLLEVVA